MKRILFSILIILALATPSWAIVTYNCDYLTGGAQRALDYISISDLNNGDHAHVYTSGEGLLFFKYVASGTTTENTSAHPYYVRPNDFVTQGVWEEVLPSFGHIPVPKGRLEAGLTTYNAAKVPVLLYGAEPISGTSVSIACPVSVISGASLYRSGTTATVYFYGPVNAGDHAWIDESSVSAYFMPGSVKEINPMWWGADGSDAVDDTNAVKAATRSFGASSVVAGGTLYVYTTPDINFPHGVYYVSGVTPGYGEITMKSTGRAIIYNSSSTVDTFDFNGGYRVTLENLTFIGGRSQVRFGNDNTSHSRLTVNNCKFMVNFNAPAVKFFLPAGSTNLSVVSIFNDCDWSNCYQNLENVSGAPVWINRGWAYNGDVAPYHRAMYVNRDQLHIDGVYGVPYAVATPEGGRWFDNYLDLFITNFRSGSEGNGTPIVYNYDSGASRWYYTGGGQVDIRRSALSCGSSVGQAIIHCVNGIPGRITIRDNDWISISGTTEYISVDSSFDAATWIEQLSWNDRIFIDVGNNNSNLPLENIGLPPALRTADPNKVRFSREIAPYIHGATRRTLLHYDSTPKGNYAADEYFGLWVHSNATPYATSARFGASGVTLDGSNSYILGQYTDALGGASRWTLEGWFKNDSNTGTTRTAFNVYGASNTGVSVVYDVTGTSRWIVGLSGTAGSFNIASGVTGSSVGLKEGTWYKVAMEFTGSEYALYCGEAGSAVTKELAVTSSTLICPTTTTIIGASVGPTNYWKGSHDEFRMTIGDYRYGGVFIPESSAFKVD